MAEETKYPGPLQSHRNATASTSTRPTNTAPRTTFNPDRASTSITSNPHSGGVVQPKPQALPSKRTSGASIIVSPRQKGNPILTAIKSLPWEYGDIPADYVLGATTCALFLSLKYHRLHPEYIYTRIKNLQGKYALRIVLVMVDITNHEESLRELSKTSLINNVTLVLCWSAAEGGRYLELFKTYENAPPTSIKQHQSTAYSDRMTDFITTPRSINKTDAVALVSQFGTVRTACNAGVEEVGMIAGWGQKKVQRWCASVTEPFRVQRAAARKGKVRIGSQSLGTPATGRDITQDQDEPTSPRLPSQPSNTDQRRPTEDLAPILLDDDDDAEAALAESLTAKPLLPKKRSNSTVVVAKKKAAAAEEAPPSKKRKPDLEPLSDGLMAALSKLRNDGA